MNKRRLRVNLTTNWSVTGKNRRYAATDFQRRQDPELDGRQPADEILQASLRAIPPRFPDHQNG